VEGVVDWWRRYVIPEVAPPPEGPDDTWALLRARLRPDERPERIATDDEEVAGRRLLAALEAKDAAEDEVAALRLALAGAAESEDVAGVGWRAKWTERTSTDWAALAREEAIPRRVIERYTRRSPMFTFRRAKADATDEPEEATL
jgi:hypothetical protein